MTPNQRTSDTGQKSQNDSEFLSSLYDDPLRQDTSKRGRWLIGVSLASISVTAYGAELTSSSGFPIKFAKDSGALESVLVLLVFLLLGEFLLRAVTDILREKEARVLVHKYVTAQVLDRERRSAQETDDEIHRTVEEQQYGPDEPDPWWEKFVASEAEATERIEKMEQKLGERSLPRALRRVRQTAELSTPLLIGFFALFASIESLGKFLAMCWSLISK